MFKNYYFLMLIGLAISFIMSFISLSKSLALEDVISQPLRVDKMAFKEFITEIMMEDTPFALSVDSTFDTTTR